jgi:hypothetical protein
MSGLFLFARNDISVVEVKLMRDVVSSVPKFGSWQVDEIYYPKFIAIFRVHPSPSPMVTVLQPRGKYMYHLI